MIGYDTASDSYYMSMNIEMGELAPGDYSIGVQGMWNDDSIGQKDFNLLTYAANSPVTFVGGDLDIA